MSETPEPPATLTPEQVAANKKGDTTVKLWAAGIIVVLILCGIAAFRSTNTGGPEDDRSNTAVAACEDSIRNQLKAPSTAKFSGERYTDNDPDWLVTGNVDAENGFGAMIRSGFSCTLTRNGDRMVTTSASLGDG